MSCFRRKDKVERLGTGMRFLEYKPGYSIRIWANPSYPIVDGVARWLVAPMEAHVNYYMGPDNLEGDSLDELVIQAKQIIDAWIESKRARRVVRKNLLQELDAFTDPELTET